jgi:hypothetical protein
MKGAMLLVSVLVRELIVKPIGARPVSIDPIARRQR